jgi:hypothetical protein
LTITNIQDRKGDDMSKKTKTMILLIALMFALMVFNDNARCQYHYSFIYGFRLQQDWRLYQEYIKMKPKGATLNIDSHTVNIAHHYIGYVIGVVDARVRTLHVPDGVTSGELCTIVGQYLDAHPNELKQNGAELVVKAMRGAFPQKK